MRIAYTLARPRRAPKKHAASSQSTPERQDRARQSSSTENVRTAQNMSAVAKGGGDSDAGASVTAWPLGQAGCPPLQALPLEPLPCVALLVPDWLPDCSPDCSRPSVSVPSQPCWAGCKLLSRPGGWMFRRVQLQQTRRTHGRRRPPVKGAACVPARAGTAGLLLTLLLCIASCHSESGVLPLPASTECCPLAHYPLARGSPTRRLGSFAA